MGAIRDFFLRALSPTTHTGGGWHVLVNEPFAGAWQRNRGWKKGTVLAHHAVYACITRISQDIGKLRPKLVQLDENGIWVETTSAAFSRVLERPNRYQNHIQFKEWWSISKLISGNTYALKERDERRVVSALHLLDPARVVPMVTPDGDVLYKLKSDNLAGLTEEEVVVPASEIIHDRMNCLFHPLVGISPIYACGLAADMGLNIERNSSTFFERGSTPSGVLTSPVPLSREKAEEYAERWNQRYGPGGEGGVAVLGDFKFTPMRMSAADSQLIEQLNWTALNVCSAYQVPPFKIGVGTQPTYQNGEILNQIYYSDCLQSHIEQFELAMDEGLGLTTPKPGGRRLGVELDLDGLLRMDGATQVKTLTEGIKGGLYTPNEARKKVDQQPLIGGDTVYMQEQNYSLAALDARDRENPLAPKPPAAETPADDGDARALALELELLAMGIAA